SSGSMVGGQWRADDDHMPLTWRLPARACNAVGSGDNSQDRMREADMAPALLGFLLVAHSSTGWPSSELTEMARLRLQGLSFFLFGFLLSSLLIWLLWNALRRDVEVLPRLSYARAVGLAGLWALLCIGVLILSPGAREWMTAGAGELSPERAEDSPVEV